MDRDHVTSPEMPADAPPAAEAIARAADRLRSAYHSGPIPPLRDLLGPDDGAAAYAVQARNADFWMAEGRRVSGRKVGLTAKAVQAQFGVDQPDYGVLFADMEVRDGGLLRPSSMLQPKAEAEVALILVSDVVAPVTPESLASAVGEVCLAIEIVDSRIADWKISFADTVADNGSSGAYVLGRERRRLDGLDLYACGMVLEKNGDVASLGAGAACLGHPLNAAAWLARTLTARGERLRAGEVVLTGALGPMVTLTPGDTIKATVGGLGSVAFRYGEC
jgi:2-keto-4-pentenoate hydratase